MKVAILTPTFNYHSGIDRVVELQARDYIKKGHEVTIIALEAKIKPKDFKVIELGMPSSLLLQRLYRLFFFLDIAKMRKYRLLKDFDVVISHFYPMNWLAYKARKEFKIKYIYWDHGINTTGLLDNYVQKMYMLLFLFFNNITLKNIDEAYSVSQYLADVLLEESKIKAKVVYNEIDEKRFNKKVSGEKIIKRYGLKGKKVFLYVGRLSPHKGIHMLIDAFKQTQKTIPNSTLIIAGKPVFEGYFKKLKKMANKDIIFTGFVADEDLPNYYGACDVYVSCSQWEGFNLPAGEAQACGKPVVAFNLGSHPEVVKNGKLIKNHDLNAFSKAMIELANKK